LRSALKALSLRDILQLHAFCFRNGRDGRALGPERISTDKDYDRYDG
jgi:hypothetical protein